MRRRLLRASLVLLLATGAALAFVVLRAYRTTRAVYFVHEPSDDPDVEGRPAREVCFNANGAATCALYLPSRNRAAVVLIPGVRGTRRSLWTEARILSDAGFGALLLDLPGQGRSSGSITWGRNETVAISAAVEWLLAQPEVDPSRIGAYGFSAGGYMLARAAAFDPRIRSVVLASAGESIPDLMRHMQGRGVVGSWGTNLAFLQAGTDPDVDTAGSLVSRISPRPLLILGGSADTLVPFRMTRRLFERAMAPKSLKCFEGSGHGDYRITHEAEFRAALVTFFSKLVASDTSAS